VHRLSVAKNDTKTNRQRSPATACRLIKNRFCGVYFAVQRAAGQLAQSHNFQRSNKNTRNCHGSNHFCLNSQALLLVSGPGSLLGRGDRSQTRLIIGSAFNQLAAKLCVSTLNEMVARNWKIFCHRGCFDQGQRLNISGIRVGGFLDSFDIDATKYMQQIFFNA